MFLFGHPKLDLSEHVAGLVLGKIPLRVDFSGAPETLASHWLPTWSISPRVFDICYRHWFYPPTPCKRGVAALSYVAPNNFPYFLEGHIPLVFPLTYFFFFFISNARSWVSRMILSAVCTCNFFQEILLHVFRVLFTAFRKCLSSSTGFLVVIIFLAFEAPQGSCDVLLNSIKTKTDLHLVGSTGLIKCWDVSVGLDWLFAFLMEIIFIFVTPCFPRADGISSSVAKASSLLGSV